ncbi:MAG TPA: ion channel protein [Microlunatus sp.]|nr:ion channel protein [Microlunatus sp.]
MSQTSPVPPPAPTPRQLLLLSVPAVIIGVLSALILWSLDEVAELIEHGLWDLAPTALGVPDGSRWWIFLVLTLTGAAVGLVVWKLPGHGGTDSATTELTAPPLPLRVLPSLTLAVIISLAGGVSLGPENPIIAINSALAIALVARLWPKIGTELVMAIAASATIGALFGTPVAAALIFTGVMAAVPGGGALWDKLFLPLVAAGAGSITMKLLGAPTLAFSLPAYGSPRAIDLLTGAVIASACVLIAMLAVLALPPVHTFFHRLRNPLVYATLGGLVLGGLGAIGGELTLFKGLEQTGELLADVDGWATGTLVLMIGIKLAALVVAAASGFRGGRIFPAVFIGVALGLLAHNLLPSVPVSLAVGCAVLGVALAIARDGWVSLFLAVVITGDVTLLPVLCLVILPAWLLVSRAPGMIVQHPVAEHWRSPA